MAQTQAPWGVTWCPDYRDWTAELRGTQGAQVPDPDGEGVTDVIAYGAECLCGFATAQAVVLEVTE